MDSWEVQPGDRLLEWCSLRQRGNGVQFDVAVQHLFGEEANPNDLLSRLQVLSHLEVDWRSGRRWWAIPPLVVMLPAGGGNAVVAGARSSATHSELLALRDSGGIREFRVVDQGTDCPAAWLVGAADPVELVDAAETIGGHASSKARFLYDDHFGDLSSLLDWHRREFSYSGFEAERFDGTRLTYEQLPSGEPVIAPGCFRQQSRGANVYWFVAESGSIHVVDRWSATYAELRRLRARGVSVPETIEYDVERMELRVNALAQLPAPWARVAAAATGLAPIRLDPPGGRWVDVFRGVEVSAFADIARSLGVPPV